MFGAGAARDGRSVVEAQFFEKVVEGLLHGFNRGLLCVIEPHLPLFDTVVGEKT